VRQGSSGSTLKLTTLRRRHLSLMAWMGLNGEDLQPVPLAVRKRKLEMILHGHDHPYARHSEPFKNGEQLLAECRRRGLEGIVSKRKHSPYKSGRCDWVKVKCAQWKEDDKDRGDLFMS
jgi:ATP-dependent DNA ligase